MILSKFRTLAMIATLAPAFAHAQDSESAYTRLHLAGELRNETQNMARLACYIGAEFHVTQHRQMLGDVMAGFEANMQALKDGDDALGLAPEQEGQILSAISDLSRRWPVLSASLNLVMRGGDIDPEGVAAIDAQSLSLLEKSETLSNRIAKVNSDALSDLPLIMTLTINMAARQVMRTERAAKEACLIGTGVNVAENRQALEDTVTVFSATIEALIDGFPGMIARAPSIEIKGLLEEARAAWAAPKAALTALYTTGEISDEERMTIGGGLEAVAAKLTAAAVLYQEFELDE